MPSIFSNNFYHKIFLINDALKMGFGIELFFGWLKSITHSCKLQISATNS
jgi:hypothetical protein